MTTQTEEPRAEASLAPVLSFGELTYPALGSRSLCRGGRNLLETLWWLLGILDARVVHKGR